MERSLVLSPSYYGVAAGARLPNSVSGGCRGDRLWGLAYCLESWCMTLVLVGDHEAARMKEFTVRVCLEWLGYYSEASVV